MPRSRILTRSPRLRKRNRCPESGSPPNRSRGACRWGSYRRTPGCRTARLARPLPQYGQDGAQQGGVAARRDAERSSGGGGAVTWTATKGGALARAASRRWSSARQKEKELSGSRWAAQKARAGRPEARQRWRRSRQRRSRSGSACLVGMGPSGKSGCEPQDNRRVNTCSAGRARHPLGKEQEDEGLSIRCSPGVYPITEEVVEDHLLEQRRRDVDRSHDPGQPALSPCESPSRRCGDRG